MRLGGERGREPGLAVLGASGSEPEEGERKEGGREKKKEKEKKRNGKKEKEIEEKKMGGRERKEKGGGKRWCAPAATATAVGHAWRAAAGGGARG